jgi:hypothetical protein
MSVYAMAKNDAAKQAARFVTQQAELASTAAVGAETEGAPTGAAVMLGAVPPGAVPPGAVPPGAVPPGAVPPGAVPPEVVPPGAAEPPPPPPVDLPPATPGPGAPVDLSLSPALSQAIESISTYIPTEVMATYLAVLAAIPSARGHSYQWLMFWTFLAATPLVVWLSVSAASPGQGLSLPVTPVRNWPWWSMLAATLAFAVFAIGLPGSVANDLGWYEPWMSTVAIILSAFVLSQMSRIVGST